MTAPTLPAYPTDHGWRVWCRYCKRWHQHGAQPGHRAAHCYVASSPYRVTGYILELAERFLAFGGDRMIRPSDPAIVGTTLAYMPITSAEAVRRLAHLAFRDCHTALDLTFAHGRFWADPLPPGLTVTSNALDPATAADLHLDFTATGLPSGALDLTVLDPPHVADGGKNGIIAARFGTVRGVPALRELIDAGVREAWRVCSIGLLVKVCDHAHQGEHLALSDWVKGAVGVPPYTVLHTYRTSYLRDGKHRVARVPRSNGAVWIALRKSGHRHVDFDRLYARQEARARKGAA